jgi:hypothetical protein
MQPLTACDVQQVLRAAMAEPAAAVLSRPLTGDGVTYLWLQGGRVCLLLDGCCRPMRVMHAVAPDGRRWEWGCQRHWLVDGAPVVDPLVGMDVEQLAAALGEMPAAELEQEVGWPDFEAVARRQMNVRNATRGRKKPRVDQRSKTPKAKGPVPS